MCMLIYVSLWYYLKFRLKSRISVLWVLYESVCYEMCTWLCLDVVMIGVAVMQPCLVPRDIKDASSRRNPRWSNTLLQPLQPSCNTGLVLPSHSRVPAEFLQTYFRVSQHIQSFQRVCPKLHWGFLMSPCLGCVTSLVNDVEKDMKHEHEHETIQCLATETV